MVTAALGTFSAARPKWAHTAAATRNRYLTCPLIPLSLDPITVATAFLGTSGNPIEICLRSKSDLLPSKGQPSPTPGPGIQTPKRLLPVDSSTVRPQVASETTYRKQSPSGMPRTVQARKRASADPPNWQLAHI